MQWHSALLRESRAAILRDIMIWGLYRKKKEETTTETSHPQALGRVCRSIIEGGPNAGFAWSLAIPRSRRWRKHRCAHRPISISIAGWLFLPVASGSRVG